MSCSDLPLPDGATAWVNRHCGAWYDERALPALHPSFVYPEVCSALFSAPRVTVDATLIAACPQCEGRLPLRPVRFVGVTLDVCERCRGVWVDREESLTLLSSLHIYRPGTAGAAHYRSAAATPTMQRKNEPYTRCVRCGIEALVSDAIVTEHGFMCFVCGSAHARGA